MKKLFTGNSSNPLLFYRSHVFVRIVALQTVMFLFVHIVAAMFLFVIIVVSHIYLFFFLFNCVFILLSRESDQCAIRARLGVASYLSTTPRWGNPAKCLSQRHNKYTCRLVLHTVPFMLSVKQGSCEYQF